MTLLQLIKSDYRVNQRNPKGFLICFLYRIAHYFVDAPRWARLPGFLYIAFYKLITEYILGSEIHWRASIGPRMRVFHGYSLVVNSDTIIGSDVVLRQGVTIGNKSMTDTKAPRIGDGVEFGASAIILGPIAIGDRAIIGAGAVVTKDVGADNTVVGNPARVVRSAPRVVSHE